MTEEKKYFIMMQGVEEETITKGGIPIIPGSKIQIDIERLEIFNTSNYLAGI